MIKVGRKKFGTQQQVMFRFLKSGYVFYVFGYHMVAFGLWTYDV